MERYRTVAIRYVKPRISPVIPLSSAVRPFSTSAPLEATRGVRRSPSRNQSKRTPSRRLPSHSVARARKQPPRPQQQTAVTRTDTVQNAIEQNAGNLVAPVLVPDDPFSVLPANHPVTHILENSSIIVHRQLEMMNVLLGFEQANKYVINDPQGNTIGYLAEEDHGFGKAMARQFFNTHRSFTTHVFDKAGTEVLRFHRPFSFISSRIRVYDTLSGRAVDPPPSGEATASPLPLSEMRVIGEAQQQWAPLRRKYNLFLHRDLAQTSADESQPRLTAGTLPLSTSTALQPADPAAANLGFAQFASVNEPLLSWDFTLRAEDGGLIGSVSRNFAGFGRELFTDTGVYALRMDSAAAPADATAPPEQAAPAARGMTLDQRAVMLATAVSIDFDYFTRDRGGVLGGGGFFPIWFPMGGGAGAEGGAAGEAGAASEAGAAGQAPPIDPQSPTAQEPTWGEENPWGEQAGGAPWDQQPGAPPQEGWGQGGGFQQGSSGGEGGSGGGSVFDFFDE